MCTPRRIAPVLALVLALPGAAHAAGHTCQLAEPGTIEVDAQLDDWPGGLARFRTGPAGDAAVTLRCVFDQRTLYLLVEVVDDKVVRTRRASAAGEDHLSVSLAAASAARPLTFQVFPGSPTGKRKLVGVPRGVAAQDTLTDKGWAVELAVPLASLAGFGRSTPALLAEITVHDADRPAALAIDDRPGLAGRLHFSTHLPAYRGFLAATKLTAGQLTLDRLVDLDGSPGTERVVAGGRFVGVLSDGFGFVELPASGADDVLSLALAEPEPGGRPVVVSHTRQRGDNGSRELVILWRLDGGGQFARLVALEVAQVLDGRSLTNRWALVPAGSRRRPSRRPRAGSLELVVEAGEVSGWDAASYDQVAPSTDVTPILTPWAATPAVVYRFDGGAVLGPEPLPATRRPRR